MEGWEGIPSPSACKDLHSVTLKRHPLCYQDMSQYLPALALTRAHSEDRCTASTGSSTHTLLANGAILRLCAPASLVIMLTDS